MTCPLARTASKRHVYTFAGEAIIRTAHAYTRRGIYRCACGKVKRRAPR